MTNQTTINNHNRLNKLKTWIQHTSKALLLLRKRQYFLYMVNKWHLQVLLHIHLQVILHIQLISEFSQAVISQHLYSWERTIYFKKILNLRIEKLFQPERESSQPSWYVENYHLDYRQYNPIRCINLIPASSLYCRSDRLPLELCSMKYCTPNLLYHQISSLPM